jgi:hypothetical protein
LHIWRDAAHSSAGHGLLTRIHQRHLPWLGIALVHLHAVLSEVEGHIGLMQEVIGEILLDRITLVTKADHEIGDAMLGISFEDMPEDRLASNLDHRFRADGRFFADPGAHAPGEDYGFHSTIILWFSVVINAVERNMERLLINARM